MTNNKYNNKINWKLQIIREQVINHKDNYKINKLKKLKL